MYTQSIFPIDLAVQARYSSDSWTGGSLVACHLFKVSAWPGYSKSGHFLFWSWQWWSWCSVAWWLWWFSQSRLSWLLWKIQKLQKPGSMPWVACCAAEVVWGCSLIPNIREHIFRKKKRRLKRLVAWASSLMLSVVTGTFHIRALSIVKISQFV